MEIIRFCRSWDVCQRTVKTGSVKKIPLGPKPLIDMPFKRVAVDIVRLIASPSEGGHWYILTLVEFTTRYPEAVSLKKITPDDVAKALLDIYSRMGVPEKVLTDQGTRFIPNACTKYPDYSAWRVSPYHLMLMKSMLKSLCQDQLKQWHRLINPVINPVLYVYAQVPQESTKLSPFQLLNGRSVNIPELKTT